MKKILSIGLVLAVAVVLSGCGDAPQVQSASGTKMALAERVTTNPNGKTVEQQNILDRIKMDNQPGSVKHLYVISAYSGQTIIYSTVRGKVTSSGKRLTPNKIIGVGVNQNTTVYMPEVTVGGVKYQVDELLGEEERLDIPRSTCIGGTQRECITSTMSLVDRLFTFPTSPSRSRASSSTWRCLQNPSWKSKVLVT